MTPQPVWMLVINYVAGGLLRGVIVGVVAWLITLLFTHIHIQHTPMAICVLLLALGRRSLSSGHIATSRRQAQIQSANGK